MWTRNLDPLYPLYLPVSLPYPPYPSDGPSPPGILYYTGKGRWVTPGEVWYYSGYRSIGSIGSWVPDSGPTFLSLSYSSLFLVTYLHYPYYIPPPLWKVPTLGNTVLGGVATRSRGV